MTKVFYPDSGRKKPYELAILSKGELLGEESVGPDGSRSTTVRCVTAEGELLAIDKDKFFKRISFGAVWEWYKTKHSLRVKWMEQRIKQINKFINRREDEEQTTPIKTTSPRPRTSGDNHSDILI